MKAVYKSTNGRNEACSLKFSDMFSRNSADDANACAFNSSLFKISFKRRVCLANLLIDAGLSSVISNAEFAKVVRSTVLFLYLSLFSLLSDLFQVCY